MIQRVGDKRGVGVQDNLQSNNWTPQYKLDLLKGVIANRRNVHCGWLYLLRLCAVDNTRQTSVCAKSQVKQFWLICNVNVVTQQWSES